jgi:hypothetical protein
MGNKCFHRGHFKTPPTGKSTRTQFSSNEINRIDMAREVLYT